jgi:hypothetical protein
MLKTAKIGRIHVKIMRKWSELTLEKIFFLKKIDTNHVKIVFKSKHI